MTLALAVGAAAGAQDAARGQDAAARARRIHADLFGVDCHIDTAQRIVDEGVDLSQRQPRGHVDLPRLRESGMVAPFFALWVQSTTR